MLFEPFVRGCSETSHLECQVGRQERHKKPNVFFRTVSLGLKTCSAATFRVKRQQMMVSVDFYKQLSRASCINDVSQSWYTSWSGTRKWLGRKSGVSMAAASKATASTVSSEAITWTE